jgi:hypothetical protein
MYKQWDKTEEKRASSNANSLVIVLLVTVHIMIIKNLRVPEI